MRLTLILALLAGATVFVSTQMLPYPPAPTIKMHTFISSGKSAVKWETIDRTHKGDKLTHAALPVLRGSLVPVDANASPAKRRAPSGYYGPHCSPLADCDFEQI